MPDIVTPPSLRKPVPVSWTTTPVCSCFTIVGLTDVIVPERNRGDIDEVPEEVRAVLRFHPVLSLTEVLALALEDAPTAGDAVRDAEAAAASADGAEAEGPRVATLP